MNSRDIYKNYVEALIKELKLRIKDYKSEIETIYFGGGTPSVLGAELLKYLLNNILHIVYKHNENKYSVKEITIESNINDINGEYINFLENTENHGK